MPEFDYQDYQPIDAGSYSAKIASIEELTRGTWSPAQIQV